MKPFRLTATFIAILTIGTTCFGYSQTDFNDVAPIVFEHCTSCHRDVGEAPFSLVTYNEISAFANSIIDAIEAETMPPAITDTTWGRYYNENVVSQIEIDAINQWILDGKLQGDIAQAPSLPSYGLEGKAIVREPDLIVEFPWIRSNASESIKNPYHCVTLPTGLTENRIIRAIIHETEGDVGTLHHNTLWLETAGGSSIDTSGNCFEIPRSCRRLSEIYPAGEELKTGMPIKPEHSLYIQSHFRDKWTTGKKIKNTVKIWFYPKEEEAEVRIPKIRTIHQNWYLNIPVDSVVQFSDTWGPDDKTVTFPFGVQPPIDYLGTPASGTSIFSLRAHSHSACTDVKTYAYLNGDTIPLLYVKKFSEDFQDAKVFNKLKIIPSGYTIKTTHTYDNTANNTNLYNYNNRQHIIAGTGQEDEMLTDTFIYFPYEPGDEDIDIAALLRNDTSLFVSIDKHAHVTAGPAFTIYPNPVNDIIYVQPGNKNASVTAKIINIQGVIVKSMSPFMGTTQIDVSAVAPGLYIIQLTDINTGVSSNELFVKL
jgi:hypothetical protein